MALFAVGLQILGAMRAGNTQAAIAERNAAQGQADAEQQALLLDRDAAGLELQGVQDRLILDRNLELFDEQFEAFQDTEVANIGASGFEFTGSPVLVAMANARQNALNRANIEFDQELADQQRQDQTGLIRFQASEARRRGAVLPEIGRFQARQFRTAATLQSIGFGISAVSQAASILMQPTTLTFTPVPAPVGFGGGGFAPGISFT